MQNVISVAYFGSALISFRAHQVISLKSRDLLNPGHEVFAKVILLFAAALASAYARRMITPAPVHALLKATYPIIAYFGSALRSSRAHQGDRRTWFESAKLVLLLVAAALEAAYARRMITPAPGHVLWNALYLPIAQFGRAVSIAARAGR